MPYSNHSVRRPLGYCQAIATMAAVADLEALLGPDNLVLTVAQKLPWNKHAAIDFSEAIDWTFFGGTLRDTPHQTITAEEEALLHQKILSALKILASMGLTNINMPDLLETLLPPPLTRPSQNRPSASNWF